MFIISRTMFQRHTLQSDNVAVLWFKAYISGSILTSLAIWLRAWSSALHWRDVVLFLPDPVLEDMLLIVFIQAKLKTLYLSDSENVYTRYKHSVAVLQYCFFLLCLPDLCVYDRQMHTYTDCKFKEDRYSIRMSSISVHWNEQSACS